MVAELSTSPSRSIISMDFNALVLTNGIDDTFYRSARNLPGVTVCPADQASTLDLMNAKTILLQEGAVEVLTEALRPAVKASAAASTAPEGDNA